MPVLHQSAAGIDAGSAEHSLSVFLEAEIEVVLLNARHRRQVVSLRNELRPKKLACAFSRVFPAGVPPAAMVKHRQL